MGIMNRCTKGDEEGDYMYLGGRGSAVINYIIKNEEMEEAQEEIEIKEMLGFDHLPLVYKWKHNEEEKEIQVKEKEVIVWEEKR